MFATQFLSCICENVEVILETADILSSSQTRLWFYTFDYLFILYASFIQFSFCLYVVDIPLIHIYFVQLQILYVMMYRYCT